MLAVEQMMSQSEPFDFAGRQRAKAESRAQDEAALHSGAVSREALRAANGVFSSLDIAGSVIRRRSSIDR
jgi:hypothetical protein